MNVPKSLVIHFTRNATTFMPQGFQPIVLKAQHHSRTRVTKQCCGDMMCKYQREDKVYPSYMMSIMCQPQKS